MFWDHKYFPKILFLDNVTFYQPNYGCKMPWFPKGISNSIARQKMAIFQKQLTWNQAAYSRRFIINSFKIFVRKPMKYFWCTWAKLVRFIPRTLDHRILDFCASAPGYISPLLRRLSLQILPNLAASRISHTKSHTSIFNFLIEEQLLEL